MSQGRVERILSSLQEADTAGSILDRLCVVCVQTTRLTGAGMSRIDGGRHRIVAASDTDSRGVEHLQVEFDEGPCLEVFSSFRPFHEPDLASQSAQARWPRFASAAVEQGIHAAFAFPLMTGGVAVGALDLYSTRAGALDREQIRDAAMVANLAALAVDRSAGAPTIDGVDLSAGAVEPWAYGAIVHNATGMVAEQLGIGVDAALLRIRAVAFLRGDSVSDVAGDVVGRRLRIESWENDDGVH